MQLEVKSILLDYIIDKIDIMIGVDIIRRLGGNAVFGNCVKFNKTWCTIRNKNHENWKIKDEDFIVEFDGEKWMV